MEKTVTILRGISGAGKSTYIKKNLPGAVVCSADHHFMDADGNYNFDPSQLGRAHGSCQSNFKKALEQGVTSVVVDNTNTTVREMRPYVQLAKQFGYDVDIVRLIVPVKVAAKRNAHNVPLVAIQRMQDRMQDIPLDWGVFEQIVDSKG